MASPTRGASSSYGWAQERSVNQYETASTSEDLEDIIENYDLISQTGSDNDSQVLLSKQDPSSTKSQYYSAAANGFSSREDTASFYSALQDGFSVNDYYETIDNPNHLWSRYAVDEMERILPKTNFQVYWCDIIYKIEPKISFSSLWNELDHIIKSSLRSTLYQFQCAKTRTYRPNDDMKVNSLGDSRRPLTILKQISGSFRSGELTAVLGPSGAGKTSLLNFLSRRREDGYTGKLYVENAQRRIKTITIPQSDYLPEYLTVRENLRFASRLKNPDRNHDHEKSVEKMSNLLGLDDCLDTRTKRISGGQQKRLAIAQELLSKPDILILDEPTSGLDSLTCHKTLSVLKDLVKDPASKLLDPIAILVTIHQPQQDVLELFDRIYVLANGGRAIYNGPPEKCVEFVEKHTNVRIPDKDYNPASFLIEVASGEYGEDVINALEAQVRLEFEASKKPARTTIVKDKSFHDNLRLVRHNSYYESGSFDKISKSNDNNNYYCDTKRPAHLSIDQQIARGSSMNTSHFLLKTRILSKRCWISILRDPKQLIARLVFHILFPIFFSLMMGPEPGQSNACPNYAAQFKLDDLVKENGQSGDVVHEELLLSLENLAFLFVLIYSLISINIGAITLSFTLDMQRSLKEFYNGWYSMKSYIIARLLTDIPIVMVLPIITLSIAYPMSAQAVGDGVSISYRVLITSMAVILGSLIGQTLGMIVAAIYIGHVSTALFVAQGLTLPMVFLSGFITRTKNMSSLVYALSNISFLRHTLEVAIIARYGFNACNCDPKSITGKDPELVGISGQLRAFTNFWMNSYVQNDAITNIPTTNNTSSSIEGQSENPDIFQLFAKQISLYNTYGIHVKSCQEVLPYQLYDLSLNETHLPRSFLSLSIFLIITQLLLFIVVKLVVHYRTSL